MVHLMKCVGLLILSSLTACAGEGLPSSGKSAPTFDSKALDADVHSLTFEQWLDTLPFIPLPVTFDHVNTDPKTIDLPWPSNISAMTPGPGWPVGILHRDSQFVAVIHSIAGDDMYPVITTLTLRGDSIRYFGELYPGSGNNPWCNCWPKAIIHPDLSIEVSDSGWRINRDDQMNKIDSTYFSERKFWQIQPDGRIVPKH